jgi:hypothetical protein
MHIMRRGQAEFALILGIVIVAVFVAIYAFSTGYVSPGGQALTDEQKAVETYVLDVVDRSAVQMLDYAYRQGGYIDPSAHTNVEFTDDGGRQVAYWQVCNDVTVPDVKANLEDGMERLLANTIPVRTDIAGKQVQFTVSDIKVDATIYDESVKFSVTLPTTIEGQARTRPYETDVPARLGRILSFSTEFAYFQKNHRALDENLMNLLAISDPEADGDCWLPTLGIITGTPFRMKWDQMRDCMHVLIDHTLTHTLFWKWPLVDEDGYVPEDVAHQAYIPQINGTGQWVQYTDLNVELFYGSERKLTRSQNEFYLMTDPDPLKLRLLPVFFVRPYNVKYDISFPVIVSVHDDTFGKDFRFATFVNIRDNVASRSAGCDFSAPVPNEYGQNCEGGTQPVDITVRDSAGHALPGVAVTFNGLCELGSTDNDGRLAGVMVRQTTGASLELYDSSSKSTHVICGVSSSSLASMPPIQMPLPDPFIMKVNIVEIEKLSENVFRIRGIKSVTDEKVEVNLMREFGSCTEPLSNVYRNYHYVPVVEGDNTELLEVPPYTNILKDMSENTLALEVTDNYYVSVVTPGKGNVTRSSLTLSQGTFTTDSGRNVIYIFAPKIVSGTYDAENSAADDAMISALYNKCGISPLSVYPRSRYTNQYDSVNYKIGCVYP